MYEIKKIWIFYVEEIYGWVAKDSFLQDPEEIFIKNTKDDTLTIYEIEALKRFETALFRAGVDRTKIISYDIDREGIKATEEICINCKRMKDVGQKCWLCGG